MRIRKSVLIAFLVVTTLVFFMNNVNSHPPTGMLVEYVLSTNTLEVEIVHEVLDVNTHYLVEVNIWVNDVFDQTKAYTSQTGLDTLFDTFSVTAVVDDKIKVEAICSVSGSLIDEITVVDPYDITDHDGTNPSILGGGTNRTNYYFAIMILAFVLLPIIWKKIRK